MCLAVTWFTGIDTSSKRFVLAGIAPVISLQRVMASIASTGIVAIWPTVRAAAILSYAQYIWQRETAASDKRHRAGLASPRQRMASCCPLPPTPAQCRRVAIAGRHAGVAVVEFHAPNGQEIWILTTLATHRAVMDLTVKMQTAV